MEPADPVTADRFTNAAGPDGAGTCANLLKDQYRAGNIALFDSLKQLLPDEPDAPSQADIAAQLGDRNVVRQAFHRFRQRYQLLLRAKLFRRSLRTAIQLEDELRHLIAKLFGRRTLMFRQTWRP
jgi:hypothetical protein